MRILSCNLGLGLALAVLARQPQGTESITAAGLQARVDFLASDLLEGRDSGHPGAEVAARYIETELRLLGFAPAGGRWQQEFALPASAGEHGTLTGAQLRFADASVVLPLSGSPRARVAGPLAGEDEDVEGCLALVDGGDPDQEAAQVRQLKKRGALGVILVSSEDVLEPAKARPDLRRLGGHAAPGDGAASMNALPESVREELRASLEQFGIDLEKVMEQGQIQTTFTPLPGEAKWELQTDKLFLTERLLPVPALRVAPLVGDALLDHAGEPWTLEVQGGTAGTSTNVLGIWEGSDPEKKSEFVVLGAHYDHVGADDAGNIWNGADDNASGTAGMLEIARALASLPRHPRRSLLLAAWGAEERGLLGSRAFAANPPVPLEQVVAYVNLDMISRNDPGTIEVVGNHEALEQLAVRQAAAHGLAATKGLDLFLHASDTEAFVDASIPTVFFFSGVHADYHQASDDPDRIDADKAARVARATLELLLTLADADDPLATPPPPGAR